MKTEEEEIEVVLIPGPKELIELVASDAPLSPEIRQYIAAELSEHFYPSPKHIKKERRKAQEAEMLWVAKATARGLGASPAEAEKAVAKVLGKTVDGLRKQITRMRAKKRTKGHLRTFCP
jgi:hypothetical protein